jgi:ureidoglycolate hydrolase
MKITAEHVSEKNFRKFGKVVTTPHVKPTSEAADYKFWSDIANFNIGGDTEIGICTVYRQPKNNINQMERHLRTPEILIPIDEPFVLPLLKEDEPDVQTEAFKVNIGEAVVINDGVWHGACLPMTKDQSSYFVIFARGTPSNDVEKKFIEEVEIII